MGRTAVGSAKLCCQREVMAGFSMGFPRLTQKLDASVMIVSKKQKNDCSPGTLTLTTSLSRLKGTGEAEKVLQGGKNFKDMPYVTTNSKTSKGNEGPDVYKFITPFSGKGQRWG